MPKKPVPRQAAEMGSGTTHKAIGQEDVGQLIKSRSHLLGFLLVSALLIALYYPVLTGLVTDWIKLPDFSHGFLVPVVALYLVWERRKSLPSSLAPDNAGLILLLTGIFLFFFGKLAAEYFTQRLSFLVVIAGLVLFLMGRQYLKALIFPLMFLVLMMPLPSILMDRITIPLQFFASATAAGSLELLGIPVLREGNVIHLANTSLEVAEACSGIRSLISLLTLGILFAYFTKSILWQRVVLVLACIPITILVNAFRVTMTGYLAHLYGSEVATGFFHELSGFVLFGIAAILFFGTSLAISKLTPKRR